MNTLIEKEGRAALAKAQPGRSAEAISENFDRKDFSSLRVMRISDPHSDRKMYSVAPFRQASDLYEYARQVDAGFRADDENACYELYVSADQAFVLLGADYSIRTELTGDIVGETRRAIRSANARDLTIIAPPAGNLMIEWRVADEHEYIAMPVTGGERNA